MQLPKATGTKMERRKLRLQEKLPHGIPVPLKGVLGKRHKNSFFTMVHRTLEPNIAPVSLKGMLNKRHPSARFLFTHAVSFHHEAHVALLRGAGLR